MKPFAVPGLFLLSFFAACGGDDDGGNGAGDFDAASPAAALCAATPTRLIVLGDSITACAGVGDKDAATCGPKIFHSVLEANHAAGMVYENKAVGGAITTDVPDTQLATVTTGPGHAIVMIYVGGNDLQKYLSQSDDAATAGLAADLPGITADWEATLAFFADSANFPDGATVIMNNQYNPFDDCTAPPINLSATKTGLLHDFNDELARIASTHDNVVLTDQHTPYLGHGHHFQDASCPHYQPDMVGFMEDLIHPNIAGHAHLAAQWQSTADALFASCEDN